MGFIQAKPSPPGTRNKLSLPGGKDFTVFTLKTTLLAFCLTKSNCKVLSLPFRSSNFVWSNLQLSPKWQVMPFVNLALHFLSFRSLCKTKGWFPMRMKSPILSSGFDAFGWPWSQPARSWIDTYLTVCMYVVFFWIHDQICNVTVTSR